MIHVRYEDGNFGQVAAVRVRFENGNFKPVTRVSVRDESSLHLVFSPGSGASFIVTAAPLSPYGAAAGNYSASITTEVVSVNASEGFAPYTYAWSLAAPDPAWTITALAPGQAKFTRSGVAPGETYTADFVCEVTDAAGRKVDTPLITATVFNYGSISIPYL